MLDNKPISKKTQILDALAQMLKQPHAARVTTAALAHHLNQSEAALYRHFPNKAAMFDELIGVIQTQLFEDMDHINSTESRAVEQLRKHLHALLLFTERHSGLTRILTGDALVTENPQLQGRVNTLIDDIQTVLQRSAQSAVDAHDLPENTMAQAYASVLMHWVLGRWLRYAQTGWQATPTQDYSDQLGLLGL